LGTLPARRATVKTLRASSNLSSVAILGPDPNHGVHEILGSLQTLCLLPDAGLEPSAFHPTDRSSEPTGDGSCQIGRRSRTPRHPPGLRRPGSRRREHQARLRRRQQANAMPASPPTIWRGPSDRTARLDQLADNPNRTEASAGQTPDYPVLIANLVWALDYGPGRDPPYALGAATLRDRVLEPLRKLRPPPEVPTGIRTGLWSQRGHAAGRRRSSPRDPTGLGARLTQLRTPVARGHEGGEAGGRAPGRRPRLELFGGGGDEDPHDAHSNKSSGMPPSEVPGPTGAEGPRMGS
jgi:hypothetical protein